MEVRLAKLSNRALENNADEDMAGTVNEVGICKVKYDGSK